ncbi:MATE family efflux transporter [Vibrio fluvialis]|uniref:Uncharacterized protein n=1 Tax=Vibrio fluvialis PG41 TaxID=1336752 RepID=S7I3A7_VIBFL|nr:MATE family efflux transporter [Vibrio fluvialis]EPP22584.1 hypothetical protein L910_4761 [Vibrio fluvialis PG41]MBY8105763.1 hypothetical protein [Vibrio fluvialis]WIE02230.1 MATE family efflux transporter [Vibrio fluvialis]
MIATFLKRALVISATRFVALSLAMVDMVMLGHTNMMAVEDYTLASQVIQVFVILAVVLSIGINIVIGQNKDTARQTAQEILGYSVCLGGVLLFISLIVGQFFDASNHATQSYFLLSASIFPLAIYIGVCNILETQGLEKKVLGVTIASAIANVVFNYIAISNIENASVAVSMSTLAIRILILVPVIYLGLKHALIAQPKINKEKIGMLVNFGRTEALTSVFFTGGISILVLTFSNLYSQEQTAYLGFALNFMNSFSVLYVGLVISLSISLSQMDKTDDEPYSMLTLTLSYILVSALGLVVLADTISQIYTPNATNELVEALKLSVAVIAIDGIALVFISWLRVRGFSQLPPLFRLAMIFIGLPGALFINTFDHPVLNVVFFMGLGNLIAALASMLYFMFRIKHKSGTLLRAQ